MTMTRAEKTKAQRAMDLQADGYSLEEFASPKLRMAARADRGHCRMTATEYATHRMGRHPMEPTMIEDYRRNLVIDRMTQRIIGGRRITGRAPGTKRPLAWMRDAVERETVRR